MPTLKKRINISLPKELEELLEILAKRDQMPKATKAIHLLENAILLEEDEVFNRIAESRDKKDAKFISHEDVWK